MPARQAAVAAGIGWDVPSLTINKMCLSGIDAIALADQLIRAGEFDVVVAGGQESMTKAPHLLVDSRSGYKYGDVKVLDHMAYDGLHDVFTDQPMGALTEQRNDVDQFTSDLEQDEFAAQSHQKRGCGLEGRRLRRRGRAGEAFRSARAIPVEFADRRGHPGQHDRRIAGRAEAGVSQGRHDHGWVGIADLRRCVRRRGDEQGQGRRSWALEWLCEIGAHGVVAGPDSTLQSQPANAIKKAIAKEGITIEDLDVIEINEAFSAVALASTKELGIDGEQGQPRRRRHRDRPPDRYVRCARITLHAALELARRRGERDDGRPLYAVASLCGAGGQGDALILRRP